MSEVPLKDRELPDRPAGAAILVIVGLLAWWFVYRPLVALHDHSPSVSFSFKWVLLQPLFFGWGLTHLVFGEATRRYFGRLNKPTILGWVTWGTLFVSGIVLAGYMHELLKAAGYNV